MSTTRCPTGPSWIDFGSCLPPRKGALTLTPGMGVVGGGPFTTPKSPPTQKITKHRKQIVRTTVVHTSGTFKQISKNVKRYL